MSQDKITLTEDWYPYSQAYVIRDYMQIVAELFNLLPHGSGIDSTWHVTQQSKRHNIFECVNAFSAMNENGYYCHTYDFKFKLIYNGLGLTETCNICHNPYNAIPGYRSFDDMKRFNWTFEQFKNDLNAKELYGGLYIECLACRGKGYIDVHTWDIKGFSFYGQKENNCCGFGLIDYLYQTMELSIHPDNKF